MRPVRHHQRIERSLQVCAAFLLLLVFLLTPVLQSFHRHPPSPLKHVTCGTQHEVGSYGFCKLCDYLKHTAGQQVVLETSISVVYLPPVTLIRYQDPVPRVLPALVLGYANKGPPTV